jgi:sugar diacid utilization regulator
MGYSDVLDRTDFRIIRAMADNNMNVSAVGRKMDYGPNAIQYHLNKIMRLTGKNPRKFYDLCWFLDRMDGITPNRLDEWYV